MLESDLLTPVQSRDPFVLVLIDADAEAYLASLLNPI